MKKMFILVIGIVATISIYSQEVFYYCNNKKISFETNCQYIAVWLYDNDTVGLKQIIDSKYEIISLDKELVTANTIGTFDKAEKLEYFLVRLKSIFPIDEKSAIELKKNINSLSSVAYSSFAIKNAFKDDMFFSNQLCIKLKKENDIESLKAESLKYKVKILGSIEFMPLWYTLICDKNSIGTSNEIANVISQSNLFQVAEPNILNCVIRTCVNDQYFGSQWLLNNTGQNGGAAGVDIKVCNAWQTTKGVPDIVTAIIDGGFEMNHPDLQANVFGQGYNASTQSSPSVVFDDHGTLCAGIVAAKGNNNLGVSGVAPNSKIMSVSINFNTATDAVVARAIKYASLNGASIISCSFNVPETSIISNAIFEAATDGRNGLGCVMVFASGNDNTLPLYPSFVSPELVLCVGGVDRCGIRSGTIASVPNSCEPWCSGCVPGSCFGPELDIVAGGTSIYTTDRQGNTGVTTGDYASFSGTSAACPAVAGVAALILSENPCLYSDYVHDIICRSGQKLSNYSFSTTSTRPTRLGSWNEEVGHGLVNAQECVRIANNYYLQAITESSSSAKSILYKNIWAGESVDPLKAIGIYQITATADVSLVATNSINLMPGFSALSGCKFSATIDNNALCTHSNPVFKREDVAESSEIKLADLLESKIMSSDIIKIYPNPTNNLVTLDINAIKENMANIVVSDIQGKILYNTILNNNSGENRHTLSVFDRFSAGVYFIKVCVNDNCQTFKVIKNDKM